MKIKKVLLGVTLSLATVFSLASCNKNNNSEESSTIKEEFSINLDKKEIEIIVGETISLNATTNSSLPLIWNSSDLTIVSVENGILTALKAGETIIKVSISDSVYQECKVKVVNALVTPTLVLNKENLSMMVNGTYTIKPTCMLGNEIATDVVYTYTSSNPSVASIDSTGKLNGLTAGETTITVKALIQGKEVIASCNVVVNEDIEISLDAEEIDLSILTLNDTDNQSHQIEAEVLVNGEVKEAEISYVSSNEAVASVSSTGLVNAIGEGYTTIEITAIVSGKTLNKSIEVNVCRTSQEEFVITPKDYSKVMVTVPTSGYLSEQILSLDVEPYAPGLDIKWSITGNGATITKQSDNRNIKVSVDPSSLGSSFTVTAILEGDINNSVSYNIGSYIPVASEAAIASINSNVVNGQIEGKYLLTNDIACQNTYSKAMIGSEANPFVGEFDGNGYTISNAKFTGDQLYLGVFGKASVGSYIHNLSVEAEFEQSNLCGGIVGWLVSADTTPAIVKNCVSKTTIANTSRETVWPSAGIAGRLEGYNSAISYCYTEITTIAGNGKTEITSNLGSVVGRSYYSNFKNCYVVVKDSTYADKVDFIGNDQAGLAQNKENNILAYSVIGLYENGFKSSDLDEKYFEISEDTISLVKGCTIQATAYISCIPSLSIVQGKTAILSYTSSVDDVVFDSDNKEVATINSKGVITALKQGVANITVKSSSNNELVGTCEVSVLAPATTNIEIAEEYTLTLYNLGDNDNKQLQLNPILKVDGKINESIFTYSISSNNYVLVSPTGLLSSSNLGDDAVVTITTIYDGKPVSTQVIVKVILSNYSVEATPDSYKEALLVKEVPGYLTSQELVVNISNYSDEMEITWEIDNDIVTLNTNNNDQTKATVTKTNKIGTSIITATVKDFGTIATFTISVFEPISSEAELVALNDKASNNKIAGNYMLTNNIVMSNTYNVNVIGSETVSFTGSFNGNGYTISNLKFANNETNYKGLFGKVEGTAHIYNLGVEAEFATGNISGALAGWCNSTISLPGIVIENCYAKTTLPLKSAHENFVAGGLIGRVDMWTLQIKNCLTEVIVVDGSGVATCSTVGGIVGRSYNGDIINCYTITSSDKVQIRGRLENNNGNNEGNVVASSVSLLGEVALNEKYWNITETNISLKNGCTCEPNQGIFVNEIGKVYIGKTFTLNPVVTGLNKTVLYSSDNESIATVDANGVVTGVASGTANITCTINGTDIYDVCTVTVTESPNVSINVNNDNIALTVYDLVDGDVTSTSLSPTLSGGTATNLFTYSSNNDNVSVDENGLVTALKVGSSIVTISYDYEGNIITKDVTFTVTISNQTSLTVTANTYTNVMVNKAVDGYVNTQELSVAITPYADGMKVNWTTASTSFITLTPNQTDTKKNTITGKADANGTTVKVTASVEGFESSVDFIINFWRAVSTEADLIYMNSRAWANSGTAIAGNYMLTNDIVMANDTARCVDGKYTQNVIGSDEVSFIGTFEGNGYTISNLKFGGTKTYLGLFGKLGNYSVIRNLGVEATFEESNICGAIAGWSCSTDGKLISITNCYAKAFVPGTSSGNAVFTSSALVGRTDGWNTQISKCYVEITPIAGSGTNTCDTIGAFIGRSYNGDVKNCYAVVVQNELSSKVINRARMENGTYGSNDGSVVAASIAELGTVSLDSSIWNVSTTSITLKKGCYYTPVVA